MAEKKCISMDSYILTKKGYVKLENLIKNKNIDLNSINSSYEINTRLCNKDGKLSTVKYLNNNGLKKLFKIKSSMGLEIEATLEHIFYVLNENGFIICKKLKELEPGDILLSRVGDRISNDKELISSDDAYLLGYLTSINFFDVINTKDNEIPLEISTSLIEKLKDILINKFDVIIEENKISIRNSKFTFDNLSQIYDLEKGKISNKVLNSNIDIQLEFLRGFFDTNTSFINNQIHKKIEENSLLIEISLMLKNIGIIPMVKDNTLIINGKEVINFYNYIGFYNYDYDEEITKFELQEKDFYVIPYIETMVKAYYNSVEIKDKKFNLNENFKYTRENVLDILSLKGNKELKELLKSLIDEHICYDEIKIIEETKKDYAFDFDLEENGSYIVNSFITHNK